MEIMKKTYLLVFGVSMVALAGCNPSDNNSDRGMYSNTNSVREAMGTNMPSEVSTNVPPMATNMPPVTGSTNR